MMILIQYSEEYSKICKNLSIVVLKDIISMAKKFLRNN